MSTNDHGISNKKFFTRARIIGIALIFVLLLVLYPYLKPSGVDKKKLYDKASADMSMGNYEKATKEFDDLVDIDSDYKDAKDKLEDAKKGLYGQALKSIKAGDLKKAKQRLTLLSSLDPNNNNVQKQIIKVDDTISKQPTDEGNKASLKPIDTKDTPVDVLPKTMEGYRIIQNGWLTAPTKSGAVYIPTDAAVRGEIDRVILTVFKFEDNKTAEDGFNEFKGQFSLSGETRQVNGHPTFLGIGKEAKPDVYPPMARVMWTRDNWLFFADVLPIGFPSSDFKKQIAVDVAGKIGY